MTCSDLKISQHPLVSELLDDRDANTIRVDSRALLVLGLEPTDSSRAPTFFARDALRWDGTFALSPPVWRSLYLNMQYQEQTEWCWSATTVSITLYYDAPSTWTQCTLANNQLGRTDCCTAGNSAPCNEAWYPPTALTATGHFAQTKSGRLSFSELCTQIDEHRPISVNLQWYPANSGGHNLAIDGYESGDDSGRPLISIKDPWWGPSTQDYEAFPGSYNGGAAWYETYLTQ